MKDNDNEKNIPKVQKKKLKISKQIYTTLFKGSNCNYRGSDTGSGLCTENPLNA